MSDFNHKKSVLESSEDSKRDDVSWKSISRKTIGSIKVDRLIPLLAGGGSVGMLLAGSYGSLAGLILGLGIGLMPDDEFEREEC